MLNFLKNFFKQTKQVETSIETPKNDFLEQLVENLKEVKNKNKVIPFTIEKLMPKGFQIKIGGLFGFVPFAHMPWKYQNELHWNIIAPYLIGHKFFGSIHNITETSAIRFTVDGKKHKFKQVGLEIGSAYESIVISKKEYGIIVEVGYNFDWENGSYIGLAHKSTFLDQDQFDRMKEGDITTSYFHGFGKDQRLMFGGSIKDLEIDLLEGKLDKYINTIVEVTVKKLPNGKNEYFVDDLYPATLTVTKTIYPGEKKYIREVISNLIDNQKITCEVLGISNKHKKIQLKLIGV